MNKYCHPGEILREGYIEALELTIADTAQKLGVTRNTLSNIVNEKTGISAEMACKLVKAFDTTAMFWLNMQIQYDLANVEENVDLSKVAVIYKSA